MHLSKRLSKLFLILATNSVLFAANFVYNEASFEQINPDNTRFISGNLAIGGNTVLCFKDDSGECVTSDYVETNAGLNLSYIDIDNNAETYNSSSSTITLPPGSKVVWAALFLQGYLHISNDRFDIDSRWDIEEALEEPVLLRTPFLASYTEIDTENATFHLLPNYNYYDYLVGFTYETVIDITDLFTGKDEQEVNGVYTVAHYQGTRR